MEEGIYETYEPMQRSEEWFQQRLGKFTASTFGDCMGNGRGKDTVFTLTGLTLIREKITEILTGEVKYISSPALDWGTYNEEYAIQRYENVTGNRILNSPFCKVEGYEEYAGGSPDGFIEGENGIIEVKCPFNSSNHIDTLIEGKIPDKYYNKYYTQIQFNIMATDTDFCDFVSFDPRMIQEELKIKIIRIERDDKYIKKIKERLNLAIEEMYDKLDSINNNKTDTFINHKSEVIV